MDADQFSLHAEIEQKHWWFTGRRSILRALVEQLVPPHSGAVVLDVGCGTGANIAALADGYRCIGIDTSSQAIELARKRFSDVEFLTGFAPRDVGDRIHDVNLVLLTDVLEHVPDDYLLLSEMLAATRPGTYFVVTVPANLSLWSEHDVSFGHYRRYDQRRFEGIWSGLPVRCCCVTHFNARLYPIVSMVRSFNRKHGGTFGKAGTDLSLPAPPINRMLHGIFAGEKGPLLQSLKQGRDDTYRHGVSLLAVLQREEGHIVPRCKPADSPADYYDPPSGTYLQQIKSGSIG